MFIEESEVIEVTGTREELDAEVRRVGLVGDGGDQYSCLEDFLESNNIRTFNVFDVPEKMTVKEIVNNWV